MSVSAEPNDTSAGGGQQATIVDGGREWDGQPQVMLLNDKRFAVELEPDCCDAYVKPTVRIPLRYRFYKVNTVRKDQQHYMNLKLVNERYTLLITVGGIIKKVEVPVKVTVRCFKNDTGVGKTVRGTIEWIDGTTQMIEGGVLEFTASEDRVLIREARQARADGLQAGDNPGREYGFSVDAEMSDRGGVCVTVQTAVSVSGKACQTEEENACVTPDAGDPVPGVKDVEISEDYRKLTIGGHKVDLSKRHKAREVLKFARTVYCKAGDGKFKQLELKDKFNEQFDNIDDCKRWHSDRLRFDLFKGVPQADFDLIFETLDRACTEFKLLI